jgi:hypothetical protein
MTTRKIRRPGGVPQHDEAGHSPLGSLVRNVQVGEGLPPVEELEEELEGYMDVLMGRVPPPVDAGILTLQEVADAYFARASEIQFQIHKLERKGDVFRGSTYYKFRTGELRTFLDLSKRAAELGSRRLTHARLLHDMAHDSQGLGFFDED